MQPALKSSLEAAAKNNARSLNAEIVARLEQSFAGGGDPILLRLLGRLEMQLAEAETLGAMADIGVSLLARYFEDAIKHLKRGTQPTKDELKAWQDELSNYQSHSIDELEDKLKESADRLADAREKLGLQPHRHKFGIYNK